MNNAKKPAQPLTWIEKVKTDSQGHTTDVTRVELGLTKREYFAGIVIQGLLANKPPYIDRANYGAGVQQTRENIKEFVEHGINIADELLKQLSETQE